MEERRLKAFGLAVLDGRVECYKLASRGRPGLERAANSQGRTSYALLLVDASDVCKRPIHDNVRSIGKIFDHRFVGATGGNEASRVVGYAQRCRLHVLREDPSHD